MNEQEFETVLNLSAGPFVQYTTVEGTQKGLLYEYVPNAVCTMAECRVHRALQSLSLQLFLYSIAGVPLLIDAGHDRGKNMPHPTRQIKIFNNSN